jgi:alkaline phosphatase
MNVTLFQNEGFWASKLIAVSLVCLCMTACTTSGKTSRSTDDVPHAKNVILFIGDGMGVSTVTAMRILDGQMKGLSGEENVLAFERFPNVALSKTYETNQQVGESAGTATAMLSGKKTKAGFVGMGPGAMPGNCASSKGNSQQSILEYAEESGLSTGVITTTRLTHATPASAFAHVPDRGWESDTDLSEEAIREGCKDIASQLLDFPYGDGIEVAMGGGRIKFFPYDVPDPEGADTSEGRQDGRDLTQEWLSKYKNSVYVWNQAQFDAIDTANTEHLLALFDSSNMQYEADRAEDPAGEPSLAEMTKKSIGLLKRNPKGYFLLVEGGRIDHGHHDGNAYLALNDGIAFANAVAVATELTNESDTLIIVTADHSHPFTIGGYATLGNPILGKSIVNDDNGEAEADYDLANDGKPYTTLAYQTGPGAVLVDGQRADLTDVDTINDKTFRQQALVPKNYGSHAGEDVAVYARGPGASGVHGVMEQNQIFDVIVKAANLTQPASK